MADLNETVVRYVDFGGYSDTTLTPKETEDLVGPNADPVIIEIGVVGGSAVRSDLRFAEALMRLRK